MHDQPEFEHELCLALDGVFAFAVIYGDEFMAARDPIGVKPLYWGTDDGGRKLFSSEMRVIEDLCVENGRGWALPVIMRCRSPDWFRWWEMATGPADLLALRHCLIAATEKRLMTDAPIGVLLSGGLDSSLISTIAARPCADPITRYAPSPSDWIEKRRTRWLHERSRTQHHECYFSVQEGIEVITQLIWHLETYDVTSIRASTPIYEDRIQNKVLLQMEIELFINPQRRVSDSEATLNYEPLPTQSDNPLSNFLFPTTCGSVDSTQSQNDLSNVIINEIDSFFKSPTIEFDADPLLFWRGNSTYPNIKQIVPKYLAPPPGTVESERTFSQLSEIFSPKRSTSITHRTMPKANSLEVRVPFLDKQFLALAMSSAQTPKNGAGQNGTAHGKVDFAQSFLRTKLVLS
ncbi:hypothetical protein GPALN_005845 [Globodera pallida]|nr:hypothetical protein GPALN_005845 [Globodera pallida]